MWLAKLSAQVAEGTRAMTTAGTYRQRLNSVILPAVGQWRLRECTVPRLDTFFTELASSQGAQSRKTGRSRGSSSPGERPPARPARHRHLHARHRSPHRQALAVRWDDVDLEGVPVVGRNDIRLVPIVAITGNIVRHRGKGPAPARRQDRHVIANRSAPPVRRIHARRSEHRREGRFGLPPPPERAARWAAREAAVRGVPLTLVYAYDWGGADSAPGVVTGYRDTVLGWARDCLRQAAAQAREAAPDVEVTTDLCTAQPVDLLSDRSVEAELVVLGDRGLGGLTGLLLGSVAVGVVSRAKCPVVVVRGDAEEAAIEQAGLPAPVVVGVDGSPASEATLAFAHVWASRHAAPLVVVDAWADTAVDSKIVNLLYSDDVREEETRMLAELLAGWQEKYPDVEVRRELPRKRPARALLDSPEKPSRRQRSTCGGSRCSWRPCSYGCTASTELATDYGPAGGQVADDALGGASRGGIGFRRGTAWYTADPRST